MIKRSVEVNLSSIRKLFTSLFAKGNGVESEENQIDVALKALDYFIQLEHYNFMSCDKNFITMESFESFFHDEPRLNEIDFIRNDGTPYKYMDLFLEKKQHTVKGKFLNNQNTSLLYLPVAEKEVLRFFSNQSNKSNSFKELLKSPDKFLVHIKLNDMLKVIKDTQLEHGVVLSPILKYFLRPGKSLNDLKSELINSLTSVIENEEYGRLNQSLTLVESGKYPNILMDLKFIHLRYKNWKTLTNTIQGVFLTFIDKKHFNKEGLFRFSDEKSYKKHIKLTYDDNVGLNSFYLDDLNKVKGKLKNNKAGVTIKTYLDLNNWAMLRESGKRIDLFKNDNIEEIKSILKKVPLIKWPSIYPLGLMQQVALNLILERSQKEEGFIFSVNGPPGTGKTTLLKDVFANILFEKVKFLKNTSNLFKEVKYGDGENDYYFSFHEGFKKYRILVTSNNNAAVENISMDLPKDKTLFNNGYTFLGYNREDMKWGKISAAMGNKTNIKKYFTEIIDDISKLESLYKNERNNIFSLEKVIKQSIQAPYILDEFNDIDDKDWQKSEKQYINIDGIDYLDCNRSHLFKSTMSEYVSFLINNRNVIEKNLLLAKSYFTGENSLTLDSQIEEEKKDNFIQSMFDTIFLVTPILSSTFAAVSTFLKGLNEEDIGWLFIDEAGQATPQSAVGAIWRSKNVVVVGDPLQIPPVVTLSHDQLKLIAKDSASMTEDDSYFFTLTRPEVSVQEFSDLANLYGGEMVDSNNNKIWLGSPLRVHRRCENPMFDICNITTYQEKMIYGTDIDDKINHNPIYESQWIDLGGKTLNKGDHFIIEQGKKALDIAKVFVNENPSKKCYIITPFLSVKQNLSKMLKEKALENVEVGTVHTFQGKEAPLVIFVLGVDDQKEGPLKWASSTPNLLNVAASRAKKYFIVIGNASSWGKKEYFETAINHLSGRELVTN